MLECKHHFIGIGYYFFSDGFWILNGQGVLFLFNQLLTQR